MARALILAGLLGLLAPLGAHDTGFGHSRRWLLVAREGDDLRLEYRLVTTGEEALAVLAAMDRDRDGDASRDEQQAWLTARARQLADLLTVRGDDGQELRLEPVAATLTAARGQLYRFRLRAPPSHFTLADGVFPHKPGVMRLRAGDGVTITPLGQDHDLAHVDTIVLRLQLE